MELEEIETIQLRDSALPFAVSWSEADNISIITENEVHILRLKHNLKLYDNSINFYRHEIRPENVYPSEKLAQASGLLLFRTSRIDTYNLINDLILTPNAKAIEAHDTLPKCGQCCWSPAGTVLGDDCALLFLNNLGNVNIQIERGSRWDVVLDLSKVYAESFNLEDYSDDVKDYEAHKEVMYKLATICIAWSPFYDNKKYSIISLGQCNGDIVLWRFKKIKYSKVTSNPEQFLSFSTKFDRITAMHWIKSADNSGILVVGGLNGLIKGYYIENIDKADCALTEPVEVPYWTEDDDIRIDKICSQKIDNNFLVVAVKRSYVIALLISNTGELFDEKFYQVGNLGITGIEIYDSNNFILCTLACLVANLRITTKANKITQIHLTEISNSLNTNYVSTYGVACSRQQAFWLLCLNYCKPINHLIIREPLQLVICHNPLTDNEAKLLNNPTEKISDYYDCIELCKLLCEKKKFQITAFDTMESPLELSMYKLKIYMWMVIVSNNIVKKPKKLLTGEGLNPNDFINCLKIKYCLQKLESYVTEYLGKEETLSIFQRKSVRCIREYLKEMKTSEIWKAFAIKNSENGLEKLIAATASMIIEEPLVCSLCDESLCNGKCKNGHMECLCIISYVPVTTILFPTCQFCGSAAHPDLEETPICVLCDKPMKIKDYKLSETMGII